MGKAGVGVEVPVGVSVKKINVGNGVLLAGLDVFVGVAGKGVDVPTYKINNFCPAKMLVEDRLLEF
jgi:hypothetical protein